MLPDSPSMLPASPSIFSDLPIDPATQLPRSPEILIPATQVDVDNTPLIGDNDPDAPQPLRQSLQDVFPQAPPSMLIMNLGPQATPEALRTTVAQFSPLERSLNDILASPDAPQAAAIQHQLFTPAAAIRRPREFQSAEYSEPPARVPVPTHRDFIRSRNEQMVLSRQMRVARAEGWDPGDLPTLDNRHRRV